MFIDHARGDNPDWEANIPFRFRGSDVHQEFHDDPPEIIPEIMLTPPTPPPPTELDNANDQGRRRSVDEMLSFRPPHAPPPPGLLFGRDGEPRPHTPPLITIDYDPGPNLWATPPSTPEPPASSPQPSTTARGSIPPAPDARPPAAADLAGTGIIRTRPRANAMVDGRPFGDERARRDNLAGTRSSLASSFASLTLGTSPTVQRLEDTIARYRGIDSRQEGILGMNRVAIERAISVLAEIQARSRESGLTPEDEAAVRALDLRLQRLRTRERAEEETWLREQVQDMVTRLRQRVEEMMRELQWRRRYAVSESRRRLLSAQLSALEALRASSTAVIWWIEREGLSPEAMAEVDWLCGQIERDERRLADNRTRFYPRLQLQQLARRRSPVPDQRSHAHPNIPPPRILNHTARRHILGPFATPTIPPPHLRSARRGRRSPPRSRSISRDRLRRARARPGYNQTARVLTPRPQFQRRREEAGGREPAAGESGLAEFLNSMRSAEQMQGVLHSTETNANHSTPSTSGNAATQTMGSSTERTDTTAESQDTHMIGLAQIPGAVASQEECFRSLKAERAVRDLFGAITGVDLPQPDEAMELLRKKVDSFDIPKRLKQARRQGLSPARHQRRASLLRRGSDQHLLRMLSRLTDHRMLLPIVLLHPKMAMMLSLIVALILGLYLVGALLLLQARGSELGRDEE